MIYDQVLSYYFHQNVKVRRFVKFVDTSASAVNEHFNLHSIRVLYPILHLVQVVNQMHYSLLVEFVCLILLDPCYFLFHFGSLPFSSDVPNYCTANVCDVCMARLFGKTITLPCIYMKDASLLDDCSDFFFRVFIVFYIVRSETIV